MGELCETWIVRPIVAPAIEPGPTPPFNQKQQLLLSEWIPAPPAAVRDDELPLRQVSSSPQHVWLGRKPISDL